MTNIEQLEKNLEDRELENRKLAKENFGKNTTLTDDEKDRLEKMKKEKAVVVSEQSDNDILPIETPVNTYMQGIEKIIDTKTSKLKLLNDDDIVKNKTQQLHEMRELALKNFRDISINSENITDDQFDVIIDNTIQVIKKYFNMDILNADKLTRKFSRMTLTQISNILPNEFVSLYATDDEIKRNSISAKERLITSVAFLTVSGPEMDQLNNYIDRENKLLLVGQRLLQCQADFGKMLEDNATLAEILKESYEISPIDTSFWSKYVKIPNRVHNEFAQNVVVHQKYKEAYLKIKDDYTDDNDALKAIDNEVRECDNKIDVYKNVLDLVLMKELWSILCDRYTANKKCNFAYLEKEALSAIDRIKRSKQNVPFPGYDGTSGNIKFIYNKYMTDFSNMVIRYNKSVNTIKTKETDYTPVEPITIDGYEEIDVARRFSLMLVILMGRLLKKLTQNTSNKYDAIMLDAYFKLFCKIGQDIYSMTDIWNIMKDFVKYSIDTWPES